MYKVYGKPACPFCVRAKALLRANAASFEYIDVTQDSKSLAMLKSNGFKSVPQIWLDGMYLGNFSKLEESLT